MMLTKKLRFIDRKKYNGIGRPKKTDYSYKSILDCTREINKLMNDKMDREEVNNETIIL